MSPAPALVVVDRVASLLRDVEPDASSALLVALGDLRRLVDAADEVCRTGEGMFRFRAALRRVVSGV